MRGAFKELKDFHCHPARVCVSAGQAGTVNVNGVNIAWRTESYLDFFQLRWQFLSNRSGTWSVEVSGFKSKQGAKEHGFMAIGAT